MKKLLCLFFALVMALSVCAFGVSAEEEVTGHLTLLHHRTDLEIEVTQLVDDFMAMYPGIKVDVEFDANYTNNVKTRILSNEAPDMCELGYSYLPKEYWPEYILPQDDVNLQVNGADAFVIDGVCYGYTQNLEYHCFLYSKPIWDAAGITELPTTIDELIADLQKIQEYDPSIIPLTSMYKTTWATRRWLAQYAATFLSEGNWFNFAAENENPLSNEIALACVNAFRKMNQLGLLDPDLMSSDWDLQSSDFAAGLIATYCAGTYANATMLALDVPQDDIGYFAFPNPDGSGDTAAGISTSYALVITKNCKYPEAAKLFVEFYTRNFAARTGLINSLADAPCNISGINTMLESGCRLISMLDNNDKAAKIKSLSGFDFGTFVQEYIVADTDENAQAVVDKYNELWNKAMAEYVATVTE